MIAFAHLGQDPESLPIFSEELDSIDLPNLQPALHAALGRAGGRGRVLGIAGHGKRYSMLSLSDFVSSSHWTVGPPEYVHADAGPGRKLACLDFAVLLVESPEGPCVAFLRRGEEQAPGGPGPTVQAVSVVDNLAPRFLADLKALADEVDVFRGQVITVRTLTGRFTEATVVILEDADLVAEERTFGPHGGSSPVPFELMNELSGHAPDADIAFVLTTNRPDALEPAPGARPGRVDLAAEIPLPDETARERLLRIFARGIDVDLSDCAGVVERTAGVTASFLEELLRKAALGAAEAGHAVVSRGDLEAALDELLHEAAALTRVIPGEGDRRTLTNGWRVSPV